jgi:hypothetical protein
LSIARASATSGRWHVPFMRPFACLHETPGHCSSSSSPSP